MNKTYLTLGKHYCYHKVVLLANQNYLSTCYPDGELVN